jgi:UDP-3-O-[3-hydroxymyristoyl] glucosamine N-acyltransferase
MTLSNIVLIGSGAVAAEITDHIKSINLLSSHAIYKIIGYIDESYERFILNRARYCFNDPYIGGLEAIDNEDYNYFPAFSDVNYKQKIASIITSKSFKIINIIHPSCLMSESTKIGAGNLIYPFCTVGPNVSIGNFNLLTSYSCISHDSKIGDFNFFASSIIAGNCTIGDKNIFGLHSAVIPSLTIGENNIIQAGMTIDKSIGSNEKIFYRYKEKIVILDH